MPDPLTIGLGAVGLGRALFGGKPKVKRPKIAPFQFSPNENDPMLMLLRRRALEEGQRSRGRTVDEIGRAGLLGSSASFDVLGEAERRTGRTLEDIENQSFIQQRLEALQLYRDQADFERRAALLEGEQDFQSSQAGLGALGDIGSFVGGDLFGGMDEESLYDYLNKRRGRGLPVDALGYAAGGYSPPVYGRR